MVSLVDIPLAKMQAYSKFSDVPHGRIFKFKNEDISIIAVKTLLIHDKEMTNLPACVILVGDLAGSLYAEDELAIAITYFDITHLSELVVENVDHHDPYAARLAPGKIFQAKTANHVFFMCARHTVDNGRTKDTFVCIYSEDNRITAGDNLGTFDRANLVPIASQIAIKTL